MNIGTLIIFLEEENAKLKHEALLWRSNEASKRWEKNHPDRARKRNKKWRDANPEKVKECDKRKRAKNPEKYCALKKQWYINNLEKKKDYDIQYNIKNAKRIKEMKKQWELNNAEKVKKMKRQSHLKTKYGLSIQEYNKMFEKQEGCCAICKRHQSSLKGVLNVDHNHLTNDIRGLLCTKCNSYIGYIDEDFNVLKRMIDYFEMYKLINANITN